MTPSPRMAPHLDPESASSGRGLSHVSHPMGISRQSLPHLEGPRLPGGYYLQQGWLLRGTGWERQCPGEHLSSCPDRCFLRWATPRLCHVSYTLRENPGRRLAIRPVPLLFRCRRSAAGRAALRQQLRQRQHSWGSSDSLAHMPASLCSHFSRPSAACCL